MTMTNYRTPGPGNFGTLPVDEIIPFPTIAGTATTTVALGKMNRNHVFKGAFVSQLTLVVPAGTATVLIKNWSVTAGAFVSLTAATDLSSTTQTAKQTYTIPMLSTLTDQQRYIAAADSLYADFTASSTITTAATGGIVGVELDLV